MSGFGRLKKSKQAFGQSFVFTKSVPTYRCTKKNKYSTTVDMTHNLFLNARLYLGYETEISIRDMVCSESDEESVINPNDVSISLCAYLRKYRVPTHSNVMKQRNWCLFQVPYGHYRTFNAEPSPESFQ